MQPALRDAGMAAKDGDRRWTLRSHRKDPGSRCLSLWVSSACFPVLRTQRAERRPVQRGIHSQSLWLHRQDELADSGSHPLDKVALYGSLGWGRFQPGTGVLGDPLWSSWLFSPSGCKPRPPPPPPHLDLTGQKQASIIPVPQTMLAASSPFLQCRAPFVQSAGFIFPSVACLSALGKLRVSSEHSIDFR